MHKKIWIFYDLSDLKNLAKQRDFAKSHLDSILNVAFENKTFLKETQDLVKVEMWVSQDSKIDKSGYFLGKVATWYFI